jgi:uncharacterized protein (DUF1015 family)
MNEKIELLRHVGLSIPTILLPRNEVDLKKWAVVACDQFTSEEEYWKNVERLTESSPSTYHIILPEVFLESSDKSERILKINQEMEKYIKKGILIPSVDGFILVERKLKNGHVRTGLIVALDLDSYDFKDGSKTIIRATEKTVLERIPPRVQIRVNAPIEVPHIMVLFDDPMKSVIEPIKNFVHANNIKPLYETELMMGGGTIKGFSLTDEKQILEISENLSKIKKEDGFLFAVGDGNHSLATAKQCWEDIKYTLSEDQRQKHPARYTLVEINNIYDEGLFFEPIHRVMFSIDRKELLDFLTGDGPEITITMGEISQTIKLKIRNSHLEVGVLQILLDEFLSLHPGARIDYIHGETSVRKLSAEDDSLGFLLPSMNKHDLFKTVEMDGALPRKTFSMGEAEEKRYYMECRKIR